VPKLDVTTQVADEDDLIDAHEKPPGVDGEAMLAQVSRRVGPV
jgi:hypothetical protein